MNTRLLYTAAERLINVETGSHCLNSSVLVLLFDPGTQFPGKKKIMLCKVKKRKQTGMVFTPSPPSQNYQEVE